MVREFRFIPRFYNMGFKNFEWYFGDISKFSLYFMDVFGTF